MGSYEITWFCYGPSVAYFYREFLHCSSHCVYRSWCRQRSRPSQCMCTQLYPEKKTRIDANNEAQIYSIVYIVLHLCDEKKEKESKLSKLHRARHRTITEAVSEQYLPLFDHSNAMVYSSIHIFDLVCGEM